MKRLSEERLREERLSEERLREERLREERLREERLGEERLSEESSSDSNMDDIDVGREHNFSRNGAFIRCGSPTTTTQVTARKKRRGIIEKRRRDRINSCLSELRRLIPTAGEKQGSAKLEKAEILQMTVDHLKLLQATGGRGFFDAHSVALDFLSLGFRECVAEVAHYLSNANGLEACQPIKGRLLSHLTSYSSQRDAAAMATLMTSSMTHLHHALPGLHPHHWAAIATATNFHPFPPAFLQAAGSGCGVSEVRLGEGTDHAPPVSMATSHSLPLGLSLLSHPSTTSPPPSSSSVSSSSSSSSSSSYVSSSSSSQNNKPYRPWGTEVGVF